MESGNCSTEVFHAIQGIFILQVFKACKGRQQPLEHSNVVLRSFRLSTFNPLIGSSIFTQDACNDNTIRGFSPISLVSIECAWNAPTCCICPGSSARDSSQSLETANDHCYHSHCPHVREQYRVRNLMAQGARTPVYSNSTNSIAINSYRINQRNR